MVGRLPRLRNEDLKEANQPGMTIRCTTWVNKRVVEQARPEGSSKLDNDETESAVRSWERKK